MEKNMIGWQEWCGLPELGIGAIKAKVDTGATTSSLHAFQIEPYTHEHCHYVRFQIHPLQNRQDIVLSCSAPVLGKRRVTDSGGHTEERYAIRTCVQFPEGSYDIDITLADRETMKYRMLLGRNALADRFIIDPAASYLLGKMKKKTLRNLYFQKAL